MSKPEASLRYRILHRTVYDYGSEVVHAHQLLYLTPRKSAHQRCLRHSLAISPQPALRSESIDAFGNPVTRLELDRPHDRLEVDAHMEVELMARPPAIAGDSMPWEALRNFLLYTAQPLDGVALEALQYRSESPHVRVKATLAEFATDCFTPGRPVLAAAEALMHKIHAEFTYAPGVTTITTPLMQVHEQRRGVCQDYAHFMISCVRSCGLPARYVSGYLRTEPRDLTGMTDEEQGLVGADASHAWVAVYAPPFGWVELDPTNDRRAGVDHVTLAWGRDFGDVSPLRGVILGGRSHSLEVSVKVEPILP
ncbi:MAG: transglutaminase family protein [Steroidobacteraceae bacterium]